MAPSTDTSGMEFEVFLSFRGPDTRKHFTSYLYHDMVDKGIRVFKDDKELQVGEKIEELFRALDDSQIYIPIFSQNFASSVWCLREVVRMVDCTKNSDGKKEILPIFFDVKPEDVKSSTGLYSNALSELGKQKVKYGNEEEKLKYKPDEVKRWGDAIREVASGVGWKPEGKEYGELSKLIVREVQLKLRGKNRRLPGHLVETDDLEHIEELLDVDSNDCAFFVIIHGTGGSGKSTLAKVIFNRYRSEFDCSSFLEDVQSRHLLDMQKKLLSETLGSNSAQEIYDTNDGMDRMTRGLSEKKVLVVVDNVDKKEQLENLAGDCCFGLGSRIIVTLRDLRIIQNKDNQTQPSNYKVYSVEEMPFDKAIQLFSKCAFRSDTPPKDYYKFSEEVVSSIGRLPLTLETVGSLFASTSRSEWVETLEDLKQVPPHDVQETLMISINKLDSIERDIFLDIACFCIGEDKTYVDYLWRRNDYSPRSAIIALLLMSLIKIDEYNCFWMHDEVRHLGRYIVKKEDIEEAGKRRWVWIDENTLDILRSNEKKPDVRALSFGISHDLTREELARFPNLKFLGGERLNFVGDFKDLLPKLRWLSWRDCSLNFSVKNLNLENLVVLNLSESKITDDWDGWTQIEVAKRLKVLDLTECCELTKTPKFSKFRNLEKLILGNCEKLSTIDNSIGELNLLRTLDIEGCASLKGLPEEIGSLNCLSEILMPSSSSFSVLLFKLPETLGNLASLTKLKIQHHSGIIQLPDSIGSLNLTHLALSSCENLLVLPDSIGGLKSLIKLELYNLGIHVLPESIGRLKNLKELFLSTCRNLRNLPDSIGELESLVELDLKLLTISIVPDSIRGLMNLTHLCLSKCKNLDKLPDSIGELESLVDLNLRLSGISVLPDSIGRLQKLKHLLLSECKNLHKLPDSIGKLESLVDLDLKLSGISVLPNSIGRLQKLKHLLLSECKNLRKLPDSIEDLESLIELDLKLSWISVLPESIGRLKNLKYLLFSEGGFAHELPDSIWKRESIVKLDLKLSGIPILPESIGRLINLTHLSFSGCKNLDRLPDSIGQMESLVELDLKSSNISLLPDSIGNLKRLKVLKLASTNIRTIPCALGAVKTLEELDASYCKRLMDEILWETWNLTRLRILDLYMSPISTLPTKISDFSSLQTLKIASDRLSPLPELPSSLNCLVVATSKLLVLPNLSSLGHLHHLEVRKGRRDSYFSLSMYTLPGEDAQSIGRLPPSLSTLELHNIPQFPYISNLQNLLVLSINNCWTPCLPDVSCLKWLRELRLHNMSQLTEIPGLGELESLKFLQIELCEEIEQLPNLSKLKNLRCLELEFCERLRAVEGLKELNSLEYVKIRYCKSLEKWPDIPASTIKWDTDREPWCWWLLSRWANE